MIRLAVVTLMVTVPAMTFAQSMNDITLAFVIGFAAHAVVNLVNSIVN